MPEFPPNTKVVGGGHQATQKAYRVLFTDAALAGVPILEAYTSVDTPPVIVIDGGINPDITFTTGDSCVIAVATEEGAPAAGWATTADFGTGYNGVLGRKLQGTNSFLQLAPDGTAFPDGSSARFNWCYRLGPDSLTGTGDNSHVLAVRYIYTGGTPPVVTWQANDPVTAPGGTEATAVWSDLNAVGFVRKIAHADAGSIEANPVLTKPTVGNIYSGEAVVQAT
mgnify:CR=1 FL=1|jgi:hypothetical protein